MSILIIYETHHCSQGLELLLRAAMINWLFQVWLEQWMLPIHCQITLTKGVRISPNCRSVCFIYDSTSMVYWSTGMRVCHCIWAFNCPAWYALPTLNLSGWLHKELRETSFTQFIDPAPYIFLTRIETMGKLSARNRTQSQISSSFCLASGLASLWAAIFTHFLN